MNESSSSDSELTALVMSQGPSTASDSDSHSDTSSTTSSEDSLHSQSMRSSKTSEELEDELVLMEVDEALESMPDLVDFYFRIFDDNDSDLEEDSESADDESGESDDDRDESGNEADNEVLWADAELRPLFGLGIAKRVKKSITQMYSMHYEEPHNKPVPQPPAQMCHTLMCSKWRGLIYSAKSCRSHCTCSTNSMRRSRMI